MRIRFFAYWAPNGEACEKDHTTNKKRHHFPSFRGNRAAPPPARTDRHPHWRETLSFLFRAGCAAAAQCCVWTRFSLIFLLEAVLCPDGVQLLLLLLGVHLLLHLRGLVVQDDQVAVADVEAGEVVAGVLKGTQPEAIRAI